MHCIGGFVVSMVYGLPRPTADIDYYTGQPYQSIDEFQKWAGPDSPLAKKYKCICSLSPAPRYYPSGETMPWDIK